MTWGGVDLGMAVTTQPDGKILVAGLADRGDEDLVVARFHTTGMPDTSFGVRGVATWDGGAADTGLDILVQGDGRIVVSGASHNGSNNDAVLLRFDGNGSLDNSFATGGVYFWERETGDLFHANTLQADGKILAVGGTGSAGPLSWELLLMRFEGRSTMTEIIPTLGNFGLLLMVLLLAGFGRPGRRS